MPLRVAPAPRLVVPALDGRINIIPTPRWPVTGELMTRSQLRRDARGHTAQGGQSPPRGYLRGQSPLPDPGLGAVSAPP